MMQRTTMQKAGFFLFIVLCTVVSLGISAYAGDAYLIEFGTDADAGNAFIALPEDSGSAPAVPTLPPTAPPASSNPAVLIELPADLPIMWHEVQFVDMQYNILHTAKVQDGKHIALPALAIPPVDGYIFSHWYDAAGTRNPYNFESPVYRHTILYPYYLSSIDASPLFPADNPALTEGNHATFPDTPEIVDPANILNIIESPTVGPDIFATTDAADGQAYLIDILPGSEAGANVPENPAIPAPAEQAITITANVSGQAVKYGDLITLTASLEGFSGQYPQLVWQYDAGAGWVNTGSVGHSYSFILNEDNYHWSWRLVAQPL